MPILNYLETDVKIPAGATVEHITTGGTNIVQVINRLAQGGGVVYADRRGTVRRDYYSARIEQGQNGSIVHPKNVDVVYLVSDAVIDIWVTVVEIFATALDFVYNTSQVVNISGSVRVQEPLQITSGEIEIKNDAGNPVPVSGTVEIVNDVGNPIPVQLPAGNQAVAVSVVPAIGTHNNSWGGTSVAAGGTTTRIDCQYVSKLAIFGNVSAATTLTVQISMNDVNWYDTDITKVLSAAGDFFIPVPAWGARYARLKTSAAANISATITGKN